MSSYQSDREEFVGVIVSEGGSATLARSMMRNATTIQRISELECSVEMSEQEAKRLKRKNDACEHRIAKLAESIGAKLMTSGDPRGYCSKLILKSGRYNTWGGPESGFGIPAQGYPASRFA